MGRRGQRAVGRGIFSWIWANPLAIAVVVLIIVLIVGLYLRNEWKEAQDAEKLRKK
jgi:hypothetical protein